MDDHKGNRETQSQALYICISAYFLILQFIRKVIDNHSQVHYIFTMIHCLCNNINTTKVDAAHERGARKACDVQKSCGTKFNCGACKSSIQDRLDLLSAELSPTLQAAE